jgi:hypothetical protein
MSHNNTGTGNAAQDPAPGDGSGSGSASFSENGSDNDSDSDNPIVQKALHNQSLIHTILLTDEDQLETRVTWNGTPRAATLGFDEFQASFLALPVNGPHGQPQRQGQGPFLQQKQNQMAMSMQDRMALTMRRAFLQKVKEELLESFEKSSKDDEDGGRGEDVNKKRSNNNNTCYATFKANVMEMNDMIRRLIPRRTDLHSLLSDDFEIPTPNNNNDSDRITSMVNPLIQIGNALLHLESPDRDWATRDWLQQAQHAISSNSDGTEETVLTVEYVVSSMAYLHHVIEQTQIDIANASLVEVAPVLKKQGIAYEREIFATQFLQLPPGAGAGTTESLAVDVIENENEDLLTKLPHTAEWIRQTRTLVASTSRIGSASDHSSLPLTLTTTLKELKTIGFVKAWVFSQLPTAVPEVLAKDISTLRHIRRVSQVVVTDTALTLHLGPMLSRGVGVVEETKLRRTLKDSLSRLLMGRGDPALNFANDTAWRQAVVDLLVQYASSSSRVLPLHATTGAGSSGVLPCSWTEEQTASFSNRCKEVIDGKDPVLKLMDDRIRQFFIFVCGWEYDYYLANQHTTQAAAGLPAQMQSGRTVTSTRVSATPPNPVQQRREAFTQDAKDKARTLKFDLFVDELAEVGYTAYKVVQNMCQTHGETLTQLLAELPNL